MSIVASLLPSLRLFYSLFFYLQIFTFPLCTFSSIPYLTPSYHQSLPFISLPSPSTTYLLYSLILLQQTNLHVSSSHCPLLKAPLRFAILPPPTPPPVDLPPCSLFHLHHLLFVVVLVLPANDPPSIGPPGRLGPDITPESRHTFTQSRLGGIASSIIPILHN